MPPNCILINTKIGNGVRIHANSVIENAVIGNDCEIGPYARIRPDTNLADNVKIGNFVKVQNKYYYQKYINYTTNPLKYAPSGFIENQKIAEVFKKRNEELCRLLLTWEEKGKCDKNSIYKHIFERIHNDIVKLD